MWRKKLEEETNKKKKKKSKEEVYLVDIHKQNRQKKNLIVYNKTHE
jgi:hypothetical protein